MIRHRRQPPQGGDREANTRRLLGEIQKEGLLTKLACEDASVRRFFKGAYECDSHGKPIKDTVQTGEGGVKPPASGELTGRGIVLLNIAKAGMQTGLRIDSDWNVDAFFIHLALPEQGPGSVKRIFYDIRALEGSALGELMLQEFEHDIGADVAKIKNMFQVRGILGRP